MQVGAPCLHSERWGWQTEVPSIHQVESSSDPCSSAPDNAISKAGAIRAYNNETPQDLCPRFSCLFSVWTTFTLRWMENPDPGLDLPLAWVWWRQDVSKRVVLHSPKHLQYKETGIGVPGKSSQGKFETSRRWTKSKTKAVFQSQKTRGKEAERPVVALLLSASTAAG